jgi:serine/threonine-protein kinase HipA
MNFAPSVHEQVDDGLSVVRIHRFDRQGERRTMALSGATLLSAEYPGAMRASWSYPRLAQQLKMIGTPREDLIELFNRMVFNALVGNDDDHPRNHAAIYNQNEKRWRLSPAFDVVPNPYEQPRTLSMQLSEGRFDIAREAALTDAQYFGLLDRDAATAHLKDLIARIADTFPSVNAALSPELKQLLQERLSHGIEAIQG